jgi:hypothetical protein
MAFEAGVIEGWIYTTLMGDATLDDLLAVDNLPANYQQGVYNTVAPEIDAVSGKPPKFPYIVFSANGSGQDEAPLCGSRAFARPSFRLVVWDNQSGSISMLRAQQIMDRVDTLLDNQTVTSTSPRFYFRRSSTAETFALNTGGRTDIGVTAVYDAITQS